MNYKEYVEPDKNRELPKSKEIEMKIKVSLGVVVSIFDQINENPPDQISEKISDKLFKEIKQCQSILLENRMCVQVEDHIIEKLILFLSFLIDYCENSQNSLTILELMSEIIATITSYEDFSLDFINDELLEIISNLVNSHITPTLSLSSLCVARNVLDYDPIFDLVKEKLPLGSFIEYISETLSIEMPNKEKIIEMLTMILAVFARHMPSESQSSIICHGYFDLFPFILDHPESLCFMFYSWFEIMKLGKFPLDSNYAEVISQVADKYINKEQISSKSTQEALSPMISCITLLLQNNSSNVLLDHSAICEILNCESSELFYQASCLVNTLAYVAEGDEFTQLFGQLIELYESTASRKKSVGMAIVDIVSSATPSLAHIVLKEPVFNIIVEALSLQSDPKDIEITADAISNLFHIGKLANNNSWIEYIKENCYSDFMEFTEKSEVKKAVELVSSIINSKELSN